MPRTYHTYHTYHIYHTYHTYHTYHLTELRTALLIELYVSSTELYNDSLREQSVKTQPAQPCVGGCVAV